MINLDDLKAGTELLCIAAPLNSRYYTEGNTYCVEECKDGFYYFSDNGSGHHNWSSNALQNTRHPCQFQIVEEPPVIIPECVIETPDEDYIRGETIGDTIRIEIRQGTKCSQTYVDSTRAKEFATWLWNHAHEVEGVK